MIFTVPYQVYFTTFWRKRQVFFWKCNNFFAKSENFMPKTGVFYISISFIAMYAANISTESNIIYLISLFIIIPLHF